MKVFVPRFNAPGTAINLRVIWVAKLYSLPFYFPLTVGDEGPQQEAEVVEVVEEDATSEWVLLLLPFVAGPTPTTSISSSSSGSTAAAVQFVLPAPLIVAIPEQGPKVVVVVLLATESFSWS